MEVGRALGPVTALPGRMREHTPPTPGRAKNTGGSTLSPGPRSPLIPPPPLPRLML